MTTAKESEKFQEAENLWDLERLLDDLANVKGESLTSTEQLTLRGLLCGYTPAKLAKRWDQDEGGLQTNLSRGVRRYVKKLMKKNGTEVPEKLSSVNMLAMLKKAGYKKQLPASPDETTIPIKASDGLVKIIRNSDQNSGVNSGMRVEIRFFTSLTAEAVIKMLTQSEGSGKEEEK